MKAYWHELSQKRIEKIIKDGITVKECLKQYKQPDWCNYPDALAGIMGCWSLTSNEKDGLRTKISKEFCKNCDCFLTNTDK